MPLPPAIPSVRGRGEYLTIEPVDKQGQVLTTPQEIFSRGVAFSIHVIKAIDWEITHDMIEDSLVNYIYSSRTTADSYFAHVRACEASIQSLTEEAKARGRQPSVLTVSRLFRSGTVSANAYNALMAENKLLTSYVNDYKKQLTRFDIYFDCPEKVPSHARKPERLTTEECGGAGKSELCSSQPRHREKTGVSSTPDSQTASQTKGSGSGVSVQVSTP